MAEKSKRKMRRLIFSRFPVIIIAVAVQIMMLCGFFGGIAEMLPLAKYIGKLFAAAMVIYLFNCAIEPSAKLTWLALLMIFPVPAALMLLYYRTDPGKRRLASSVLRSAEKSRGMLLQDEEVFTSSLLEISGTDALCRYINRSGCFPVWRCREAEYFSSGESYFDSLLKSLRDAEKFIFIESYIIAEGVMWGKILDILREKACSGVEVRVMYDGMCEISPLSFDYAAKIRAAGIKCHPFSPVRPFISTRFNYRDHRKIAVIDGKTAYTGGINLADEYINVHKRFGRWKDAGIVIKGEAAQNFTLMFLQMWDVGAESCNWKNYLGTECEKTVEKGFVMPFGDSPLDNYKVGRQVYLDILDRAVHYVHIMTPYLVIDAQMENALCYAALRGVDVRLILPGIPDKKAAFILARSHYGKLIGSGVKIYEYTPGFVHSKVFVSDDEKAVVGSINLDYRSLYHHFECAAYLYAADCIADIEHDFLETLRSCRLITVEDVRGTGFAARFAESILKIIAPLI